MLRVYIVLFHFLSVLTGATSDEYPEFRRYPVERLRNGPLHSSEGAFRNDFDCDRDDPVSIPFQQLYPDPRDIDCLRCMIPVSLKSDDTDLCICLLCLFKMMPRDVSQPIPIDCKLDRLKCDRIFEDENNESVRVKHFDFYDMLTKSEEEIGKSVAEAKSLIEEFTPTGSEKRENGKSSRHESYCREGVCNERSPRFRESMEQIFNKAFDEMLPWENAAGERAGTDSRYEFFDLKGKSRAGSGSYDMPYPKPTFHLTHTKANTPGGKEVEPLFQTRREKTSKTDKSESKIVGNNENSNVMSTEVLKTPTAERLGGDEGELKNRNIELIIAVDPEMPAWQSPSTNSDEYPTNSEENSTKSIIMKDEKMPENELENSVEIREFDEEEIPLTTKVHSVEEEESTTTEAYSMTAENKSKSENLLHFTSEQSEKDEKAESTEELRESVENDYSYADEKTASDASEEDLAIGYRRMDEPKKSESEMATEAGREHVKPKVMIEIGDAKDHSNAGFDGIFDMKVNVYGKGDLRNVYRFLTNLLSSKSRSNVEDDSFNMGFQTLLVNDFSDYA